MFLILSNYNYHNISHATTYDHVKLKFKICLSREIFEIHCKYNSMMYAFLSLKWYHYIPAYNRKLPILTFSLFQKTAYVLIQIGYQYASIWSRNFGQESQQYFGRNSCQESVLTW